MLTTLVIGYGNDLRGDDAIGQQVAKAIKYCYLSSVQSIAVHQLTPDLAAFLANVKLGILLLPSDLNIINTHISHPSSLLAFSQILYGYSPPAWLISVPGVNFEISDRISPTAEKGIVIAIFKIMQILNTSK
jgi:Ni,Fe-hydrogenase maturation factor